MSDPPPGTLERWALDLVRETSLEAKLAFPAPPRVVERPPRSRRLAAPGRDPRRERLERAPRVPRGAALGDPAARARLWQTFLHHEIQAAELFAWALLAFPAAPPPMRRGFAAIAVEELRHGRLYAELLAGLGRGADDFAVRDWFWQRVPACVSPQGFLAAMGLGLEAGNLDHALAFAADLRAVGDEAGARVLERVRREEIRHVRFAARWLRRLTGELSFDRWRAELPPRLWPGALRGARLDRKGRRAAGLPERWLAELAAVPRTPPR